MTIGRIPEENAGNWAKSIKGREDCWRVNYSYDKWKQGKQKDIIIYLLEIYKLYYIKGIIIKIMDNISEKLIINLQKRKNNGI